ncbi:hypothetical protein GSY74_01435 [Sulfurovum sp. bin170]|uniref:hypothetical protein n=1 Tax=Sulfurovum sp. bin170 TaxID=2695268 RepID=UPI0013DF4236|nr:hypothetical protein [Sulfurovum sp. bin170]NEW59932.1 hypothetical protein [Sulfurovum sp. bin170]
MKTKYLYMLLLAPLLSFAELNIEKVNEALSSIESNKKLSYFSNNKNLLTKLKIKKTASIKKADILLFPKSKSSKKIIIVDSYSKLKENKKSIGAIYVKKGRTQIMFVDERLKKNGLRISNKKYRISECHLNPICFLKLTK